MVFPGFRADRDFAPHVMSMANFLDEGISPIFVLAGGFGAIDERQFQIPGQLSLPTAKAGGFRTGKLRCQSAYVRVSTVGKPPLLMLHMHCR